MITASVPAPATRDLGKELGRYSASFGHTWGAVVFSVVCLVLAPVVSIGLTMFWSGLGPGMAEVMETTPFLQYLPLILGGVLLLVALMSLYKAWRAWPTRVTLYERGFEYQDRQGTQYLHWDDIANITQHIIRHYYAGFIPVGTTSSCVLNDRSGGMIVLDDRIGDHKVLGERMMLQMAEQQVPQCLAEIRAGKLIEFGALTVDQGGIHYGNKVLPWNEVKDVKVQNGSVTIFKQGQMLGKWANLSGQEVSDAYLFLRIAQQFLPQQ